MIIFVHLLNDMSGSPRVLRSAIAALAPRAAGARLFVGSGGSGLLDDTGIQTERYWYHRTRWRILTLVSYLTSQIVLYRKLSRAKDIPADAIVYVNTLLPFGAALWGRRTGRRVVYHLHEVSVSPGLLRRFLTGVAARTASQLIYVSDDHRRRLPIPRVPVQTIPNAIDDRLLASAAQSAYEPRRDGVFNVLMLASLRPYKGIAEFIALAAGLSDQSDLRFELVLNEDESAVSKFFSGNPAPANVTVHARTGDPTAHYNRASLVLNLSRPDQWIETFGLSLIEAMAFGIPVIAPPIGGPLEIMTDGQEGFLVDCRDSATLRERVLRLADDQDLCRRISSNARQRATSFSPERFAADLRAVIAPLGAHRSESRSS